MVFDISKFLLGCLFLSLDDFLTDFARDLMIIRVYTKVLRIVINSMKIIKDIN